MNRGEVWQSFETPLAPSLSSNTLSFNARKPEWILYAGQKCETPGGWQGKVCHEEVSLGVRVPRLTGPMVWSGRGLDRRNIGC